MSEVETLTKIMQIIKAEDLQQTTKIRLLREIQEIIFNRLKEYAVMDWCKKHPEEHL